MKKFTDYLTESQYRATGPVAGDSFAFFVNEELCIEFDCVSRDNDDIVIEADEFGFDLLEQFGVLNEIEKELYSDKQIKMAFGVINDPRYKGGNMTEIVRKIEQIAPGLSDHPSVEKALQVTNEAEYQGRDVELNKPMRGDVKKFKVYVKDPKTGNVKKVNFGDPNMEIKRDDPARRRSFRARHNCADKTLKKDGTTASYWSCRMWTGKPVSQILRGK